MLISVVPALDDPALAAGGIEPFWVLAEQEDEVERVSRYLQQKVQYLAAEGISARTRTAHGAPAEEILRIAAEERADLIALATHGHGGLEHLWMGSVATKIVQGASVPVLLLRSGAPGAYAIGEGTRRAIEGPATSPARARSS